MRNRKWLSVVMALTFVAFVTTFNYGGCGGGGGGGSGSSGSTYYSETTVNITDHSNPNETIIVIFNNIAYRSDCWFVDVGKPVINLGEIDPYQSMSFVLTSGDFTNGEVRSLHAGGVNGGPAGQTVWQGSLYLGKVYSFNLIYSGGENIP